ncbi:hypothetical protein [Streptomyces sp. NPDC048172]|uniref:hypothetical protein n=1 Tax=Streptomyces sp. NPDC048172 TaxID=3365505 RepID=UPI0037231168
MKSWRSRIAVGLAIGAAAVTIPLAGAGSASADPAPAPAKAESVHAAGWKKVGGWRNWDTCHEEGQALVRDKVARAYDCRPVDIADPGRGYDLWADVI